MSTSSTSDPPSSARRSAALIAGVWGGALLGIGGIAAPAAFASASTELAGRVVGRMFALEARLGLAAAVVLIILLRRVARDRAARAGPSLFSPELMLVLGAVFCTAVGYFAMQPMMAQARAGVPGVWSFGALHALSTGLYGLKTALILALAWRVGGR